MWYKVRSLGSLFLLLCGLAWLVHVVGCVPRTDNNYVPRYSTGQKVLIAPNDTKGIITYVYSASGSYRVQFFDALGEVHVREFEEFALSPAP